MTAKFKPRLDILPPAQQSLWPDLKNVARLGFTLYGGTAIALRLGHRHSVDFDFFTEKPLDREALKAALPFIERSTTVQDQDNTWVVLTPAQEGLNPVKVSFFGTIAFGRVGEPDFTEDGILQVASLDDLMATKVKVVLQRAEAKDYQDVLAMLKAGVSLSRGLASARLLYGPNFQPSVSLKALSYFKDGDLEARLSAQERSALSNAAGKASKERGYPDVTLRSKSLSGLNWEELSSKYERLANFKDLEKQAGVLLTLWKHAMASATQGIDSVDWEKIERQTIMDSISVHGQDPAEVADLICKNSPGAVSPSRQAEIHALVTKLSPELQTSYTLKPASEHESEP